MDVVAVNTQVGSPSIVSAFKLLDIVAAADVPLGLMDIVRAADLPKSSIFRLLGALESVNAVTRRDSDKKYLLGPKLREYSDSGAESGIIREFTDVVAPVVHSLNETMQFGVLTGSNVTFIACINSTQLVRLVASPGRQLAAHATATGKAILAFSEPTVISRYLQLGLAKITPQTIVDVGEFTAQLAKVRDQGFAVESEESTANLSCIAAPVFGEGAAVLGAVTVCVPRSEIPAARAEELTAAVLKASAILSERLRAASATPLAGVSVAS